MRQAQAGAAGSVISSGSKVNTCGRGFFFDPGYQGGSCVSGICKTPMTRPDKDGYCTAIPASQLNGVDLKAPVASSLKLTGVPPGYTATSILSGGADYQKFKNDCATSLSQMLQVPPTAFQITDVSSGSLIVSFQMVPVTVTDATGTTQTISPSILVQNLDALRPSMSALAASSGIGFLGSMDPSFGSQLSASSDASSTTVAGAEALLRTFNGNDLTKIPPKTVNNPLVYTMTSIGLANRQKVFEYLPGDRSGPTQDENWNSPASIDIDVGLFISPLRKTVSVEHFCPVQSISNDPVTRMWSSGGPYGGAFANTSLAKTNPAIQDFLSWRIPANRRTTTTDCASEDWLKALQVSRGTPKEQVTYTSENAKNLTCGIPDSVFGDTCLQISDLSTRYPNRFRSFCNTELFPSSQFDFTVRTPLNGKWVMQEARDPSATYTPEWQLDQLLTFFFTWDQLAEDAEAAFMAKSPAGGDFMQLTDPEICASLQQTAPCVQQQLYAGKLTYKGTHSGDNFKTTTNAGVGLHQLPASTPALMMRIELALDVEATVALVKRAQPSMWPSDEARLRQILNCNVQPNNMDATLCQGLGVSTPIFPYIIDLQGALSEVSIAADSSLSLKPGQIYTVDVMISIQSVFLMNFWAGIPGLDDSHIATWKVEVTRVKLTSADLGFNQRSQSQVRARITIDAGARRLLNRPETTAVDALTAAGSWNGLWGIAAGLVGTIAGALAVWGSLGPNAADDLHNIAIADYEKELEARRAKAVETITKELEEKYKDYDLKIDPDKVRRFIVTQPETSHIRQETRLADLADSKDEAAKGAEQDKLVPDALKEILGRVDDTIRRLGGQESPTGAAPEPDTSPLAEEGRSQRVRNTNRELKGQAWAEI